MKGIIVVNAYAQTKSELNQAIRLQEEFKNLQVQIEIFPTDKIAVIVNNGNLINRLDKIDFCVYLDKDKHILQALNKLNIKIFNNASGIEICDDKLLTHLYLANNGIPMPKTIGGVLCYYPHVKYKQSILDSVETQLEYPIIVKECYGSCGKGVYLANSREELEKIAENVKLKPHLFQQFIKESQGTDIRVILVGKKCVGAMCRQNAKDFRSNIEIGGIGKKVELKQSYIEICEKVAQILNLDYCGIDLLIDNKNTPLVCEVNSNAFFGMFEQITGINVAKIYAQYIFESVKKIVKKGENNEF